MNNLTSILKITVELFNEFRDIIDKEVGLNKEWNLVTFNPYHGITNNCIIVYTYYGDFEKIGTPFGSLSIDHTRYQEKFGTDKLISKLSIFKFEYLMPGYHNKLGYNGCNFLVTHYKGQRLVDFNFPSIQFDPKVIYHFEKDRNFLLERAKICHQHEIDHYLVMTEASFGFYQNFSKGNLETVKNELEKNNLKFDYDFDKNRYIIRPIKK